MAAAIAVLLLIFLVVVINACQDSARKNALRGWNQDASRIVTQSDTEVGDQFFETVRQQNQDPEDLQSAISGLRATADTNLDQAKDLDTPDEVKDAQTSLLIALEMRRNALQFVSENIQTAVGSSGDAADQAIEGIGGQMQAFLASDTIIRSRVTPLTRTALERDDVVADPVTTAGTLPGLDWLDASYVAEQIGTSLTGTEARERNEPIAPGLHGSELTGTTFNDVALEPDPAANEVTLGGAATIAVTFNNGGENDETNVRVKVTLEGPTDTITARGSVAAVTAGSDATAEITLDELPTAGEVYTVNVEVLPVPGEEKTDNNSSSYNVLFN